MASEGSVRNKQEIVATVASKLFAAKIDASHVIIEELERVTDKSKRAESVRDLLGSAIDVGIAANITDDALRTNSLAIWVETRLGITTTDANPAWHRARPRNLDEAAREPSADADRNEEACRAALRTLLLTAIGSPLCQPKVEVRQPPCSLAASCAGCTERSRDWNPQHSPHSPHSRDRFAVSLSNPNRKSDPLAWRLERRAQRCDRGVQITLSTKPCSESARHPTIQARRRVRRAPPSEIKAQGSLLLDSWRLSH
jgi:hypothetical protein